jgi:hypothetical protein
MAEVPIMAQVPAWFDEDYYLAEKLAQLQSNPNTAEDWADKTTDDVLQAFTDAGLTSYEHYVEYGDDEGLSPNEYFDYGYYVYEEAYQLYEDGKSTSIYDGIRDFLDALDESGMTAYEHFHLYGWEEGLDPSPSFDVDTYFENKLAQLQSNEDTAADWAGKTVDDLEDYFAELGLDPVQHYIEWGADEGISYSEVVVNNAPVAQNDNLADSVTISAGEVERLPLQYLTQNDSDPDGDAISVTDVSTNVEGAQVRLLDTNHDGVNDVVAILLPADYADTTFTFQYTISDGTDTATANATVGVGEGNGGGGAKTIPVSEAGSYDADPTKAETFVFQEGNYEYTISGFDLNHDVLDLPDSPAPTVINTDPSDGEVTVQWASGGQVIQVHLTGLPADVDGSLFFLSDFGDAVA